LIHIYPIKNLKASRPDWLMPSITYLTPEWLLSVVIQHYRGVIFCAQS